jgi:hypothetical protein
MLFAMGYLELDLALCVNESPTPIESSTPQKIINQEPWEQFNHLSFMFSKSHITKCIGILFQNIVEPNIL